MTYYDVMVDIDDVLFPLATKLHDIAFERGLHDGAKEALEVWHGWKQYGCEKQEWLDIFAELASTGYYTDAIPFPGAVEALRRLHYEGHRVHLVTARGFPFDGDIHNHAQNIRRWTTEWVEEWAIPKAGPVIFSKDKVTPSRMVTVKGMWDFAVDDGDHNYQVLHEDGVMTALMTRPHNLAHDAKWRVNDLDEFVDEVLRRAAGRPQ